MAFLSLLRMPALSRLQELQPARLFHLLPRRTSFAKYLLAVAGVSLSLPLPRTAMAEARPIPPPPEDPVSQEPQVLNAQQRRQAAAVVAKAIDLTLVPDCTAVLPLSLPNAESL